MKDGKYVILVVEDDPKLMESVTGFLEMDSYTVLKAADGARALEIFFKKNHIIDLILLDVMIPEVDGYQVLKEIREYSKVPIIMMTAREAEEDQLEALYNGADNYIVKPFRLRVLKAHMEILLNRNQEKNRKLVFGNLVLDPEAQDVTVCGRKVSFTAKEFALLLFFVKNNNKVLSRDMILDHVWGYDYNGDIRTVDTLVKQVRRKLTNECPYIFSVYGLGYSFKEV